MGTRDFLRLTGIAPKTAARTLEMGSEMSQVGSCTLDSVRVYHWADKSFLGSISNLFSLFSLQAPREALSQMVLAEVPKQLVAYYKWQGWPPVKPPEINKM